MGPEDVNADGGPFAQSSDGPRTREQMAQDSRTAAKRAADRAAGAVDELPTHGGYQ